MITAKLYDSINPQLIESGQLILMMMVTIIGQNYPLQHPTSIVFFWILFLHI